MIPELNIELETKNGTRSLDKIDVRALVAGVEGPQKQIDFALAQTLNDLAFRLQGAMPGHVADGRFTIRRNWIAAGWKVRKANRTALTAEVFHLNRYVSKQEFGGTRRAETGPNRALFLPAKSLRPGGMSKDPHLLTTSETPRKYIESGRGFSQDRAGKPIMIKGGHAFMERRAGTEPRKTRKGGRAARMVYGRGYVRMSQSDIFGRTAARTTFKNVRLKRETRIRFWITPQTELEPRLGFGQKARVMVIQEFRELFARNFVRAMATARD